MKEKENRRVRLTKTMLKNSLIELLQKQPINRITVKDICENADVNRSTFYVYYSDQYALLTEIEDEIIIKTKEYVEKADTVIIENKSLQAFLNYIAENINIFRVLICGQWDNSFQKRFMDIALERLMKKRKNDSKWDEEISDYIFRFAIMGSMSIIQNWINHSLDKSTKEVADIILSLVSNGISAYE